MKALAQDRVSVTRVTKCHCGSCQMTHDQERTEGGGGTQRRALEEMQREGGRRQAFHSPLVLVQPLLSSPVACAP